ncbi:MAG: FtsX-like permease family protein [Bacteroidota bacterium]|nr:ABC transporter permease [Odoribacter sp.]MDP3642171.1 FtsX-like permease family protein [Bacteroidota bacterium]
MTTNIKLAWRNLWRNKRRTLITVSSIFFGVLLSAYMTSMQEGSYSKMVEIVVKFYSGYMQVHHEDYWENKSINNSFDYDQAMINKLKFHPEVNFVIPRLESFGLASAEELTRGAAIFGIVPDVEDQLTGIAGKISSGKYLQANDDGVVIGDGLARFLKLQVNDTLVIITQGYHGISAAGKFAVLGLIKHVSPEFNKSIIYMELKTCQSFLGADNKLTSLVVNVAGNDAMNRTMKNLKQEIKSPYSVMSWEEMQPEIVQQIESDRAGGVIMKAILYIVIAFGILGTIMMMIAERRREFGVMISIGMQKSKLAGVLFIETLFIGLLGIISGIAVSLPLIFIQAKNPVPLTGETAKLMEDFGFEPYMFFSTAPEVFWQQAISIFIISALIGIYPIVSTLKIKEIKALRG